MYVDIDLTLRVRQRIFGIPVFTVHKRITRRIYLGYIKACGFNAEMPATDFVVGTRAHAENGILTLGLLLQHRFSQLKDPRVLTDEFRLQLNELQGLEVTSIENALVTSWASQEDHCTTLDRLYTMYYV